MFSSHWSQSCAAFLSSTLLLSLSTAKPLHHVKREDSCAFDYIIVGGGTAGLTLANRLTADGTHSVIVLEAGDKPTIVQPYQVPGADQQVTGSPIDWNFGTVPQPGLNDRQLTYSQGKCLGGSSAINGLAYTRASASIYDKWASLGNDGWTWNEVLPYFIKSTTFNAPTENNVTALTFDASVYSNGPLQISYPPYVEPMAGSQAFLESLSVIGVPIVQELNAGNNTGCKHEPLTQDARARRSTSYDDFYLPVQNRTNLKVLTMSPVQQLILEPTNGTVVATGVVYIDYATGQTLNVTAKKEVIISAGAIKTPHVLMLSGIGPSEDLIKAGIKPMVDSPNVGKNMQDHNYHSVIVRADPSISDSPIFHDISKLQEAGKEWQSATGPLTAPPGLAFGFEQIPTDVLTSINATGIIAAGRTNQSHIEYFHEDIFYPNNPFPTYPSQEYNTSYISFTAGVVAPTSRGSVTIVSNNPNDPPHINPNYLNTTDDIAVALYAFKNLRKVVANFASTTNFTIGAYNGEVRPGPTVQSDEDIVHYIRETSIQIWHASGTCSMLPQAQGGVVDSKLRVYGVQGLRVVDASVIPVVPDAHTQAAVYMIAEKAADLILSGV